MRNKPSILLTIAIVMTAEFISALTLGLLELPNTPLPWSFVQVWQFGLYKEVLLSLALGVTGFGIGFSWYRGGVSRYFAKIGLGVLIALAVLLAFIMMLYQELEGGSFLKIGEAWDLVQSPNANFLYSVLICTSLAAIIGAFLIFERLRPANRALGNAHFANGLEVHRANFYKQEEESLIIGKKEGLPIYSNNFEHVLVFAPSGSGKTRSIAIPNLFHFPYSVVCNDIKFTLFDSTSGYRKNVLGHECYCFAPTRKNGFTHCFNPLSTIAKDKLERITDIQQIAHILMPDNPKEQPIWTQASRKLFKTLVLYLLDTDEQLTTLGELSRLVKQENFDEWLKDKLDNTEHLDPEFYRNGYSYLNNHEKTRQGILETFSGYFELFDDPFVDAATSRSDFDFADLRKKKMTIYVGFTDEDMERLAPLLTLFWQQLISSMIKHIPDPKEEPYPLLCLIDEFSSLGRIERLRRALKLFREYRVRCILMFQYIAQTYEKYSHDEAKAFINIKTKIAYTTEDINDAEFISKMLGTRTKRIVSRSITNQQHGMSDGKSISYQAIPLMRPDEVMKLSPKVSLIIRSGVAPIKARQFIWYNESMKNFLELPLAVPRQSAKQVPFLRQIQSVAEELCLLD